MERKVIKKAGELREYLMDFGKNFAIDTETTSLSYMELEIEGFSLCDGKKACYVDLIDNHEFDQIMTVLQYLLKDANTIIGQNLVYDMKVLHKYNISIDGKKIYDTMIADHLIDENRPHGLKHLAKLLLGHEAVKYEEAEKAGHQSDLFYEYAINDAVWTWELCMYQQPILKRENLVKAFRDIEMPFQFCLLDMEINGMLVDTKNLIRIRGELEVSIDLFNEELHNLLGERCEYQKDLFGKIKMIPTLNFASGKVLQEVLFKRLNLKVIETTPGGMPSTGKTTINAYKNTVPFVGLLNRYKIVKKLLSAYFSSEGQIMRNLDSDGRVRSSFRDTGTTTGRLSCSNPNLQQLPKTTCWKCGSDKVEKGTCQECGTTGNYHTRACFVSGKRRTMITCDYSGQEVRVMAEISRDKTLVEALNNGYDMHLAVANKFYQLGIPNECLVDTHPQHNAWKKRFKSQRTQAKVITFGLAYGKGAFGFAKDFGVSEVVAQKMVDDYFEGMPGLLRAIDKAHAEVKKNGSVTYLSGRKRHFPIEKLKNYFTGEYYEGYSKRALRQAFNAQIQGFSADMMRMAMVSIRGEALKHPEYGIKMEATVHDEVVLTVDDRYVTESSELVKGAMESAVNFCVPTPADIGIGANYDEAK